jgi:PIN domain nuclease of toxin-antitoxin system
MAINYGYHDPHGLQHPFDRMLIAQASTEGCALVTSDREILKYKTKHMRVIL